MPARDLGRGVGPVQAILVPLGEDGECHLLRLLAEDLMSQLLSQK
jgi:hypothetical protein